MPPKRLLNRRILVQGERMRALWGTRAKEKNIASTLPEMLWRAPTARSGHPEKTLRPRQLLTAREIPNALPAPQDLMRRSAPIARSAYYKNGFFNMSFSRLSLPELDFFTA